MPVKAKYPEEAIRSALITRAILGGAHEHDMPWDFIDIREGSQPVFDFVNVPMGTIMSCSVCGCMWRKTNYLAGWELVP